MCHELNVLHESHKDLRVLLGERVRFDEPLSSHSSLRIGGPARVWAEPYNVQELEGVLQWATAHALSVVMVGLGSNTLFPDEGIDGVVVRLSGELAGVEVLGESKETILVRVGGGAINAHVVRRLWAQGFVGMEFLALIPGTFGGSVVMNAGTKEQEISSILHSVTLMLPDASSDSGWSIKECAVDVLNMTYRHSMIPDGAVVLYGTIAILTGDADQARALVQRDKDRRNATQPYRLASVGSTFANPDEDWAGRLIESVGLKGASVGGAKISELHANFFINAFGATSQDFLMLMARARCAVRAQYGIELRPEVRFVGFDGWARLMSLEARVESARRGSLCAHVNRKRFAGEVVGVLLGGRSAERAVSLKTGDALASALKKEGHKVRVYDIPSQLQDLIKERPAAVLLGLHGGDGEDGTIQGFLEMLGIPYTGSGVLASSLAMDKHRAKTVMQAAGVRVPKGVLLDARHLTKEDALALLQVAGLSAPWIVKANDAGSSCGVHLCHDEQGLDGALEDIVLMVGQGHASSALIEAVLPGPEYSVGFFGDRCLGAVEITPAQEFYDFHAKYESQETSYTRVDGALARDLGSIAFDAWRALGCRGVGRVDVMADEDGVLHVLEVNTIPGMTSTSIVPKLAHEHGVSFERFASLMVSEATTDVEVRRGLL